MRVAMPGGYALNAVVEGPQEAPWLVLSNSLAADLSMWDEQAAWLARHYRLLRYDTRGHGGSDAPPGPYTIDALAGDVLALLDHVGAARASFMGLSLGGMTGLALAARHPDRIARLVCCAARADAPPAYAAGWEPRIASVATQGMAAVLSGTLDRWLSPATQAAMPGLRARLADAILRTDPAGYAGCARAIQGLDLLPDLGRIVCPTLLVAGGADAGIPLDAMHAVAAAIPGARLAVVADAAHIVNLDQTPAFDRVVADFLVPGA